MPKKKTRKQDTLRNAPDNRNQGTGVSRSRVRRERIKFKLKIGRVRRLHTAYKGFVANRQITDGTRIITAETNSVRSFIWRDHEGKKILIDRIRRKKDETLDISQTIRRLETKKVDGVNTDKAEEASKIIIVMNKLNLADQDEISKQVRQLTPSQRNKLQLVNIDQDGVVTNFSDVNSATVPAFSQLKADLEAGSKNRKSNAAYQTILDSLDALSRLEQAPNPTLQMLNDQLNAIAAIEAALPNAQSTSTFNKKARNDALAQLGKRLTIKRQALLNNLGDQVQNHLDTSEQSPAKALSVLLTTHTHIQQELFKSPDAFRAIVNRLPNTLDSHTHIEEIEKTLTVHPRVRKVASNLLTVEIHKIFYQKKTEIMETVIARQLVNTNRPGINELRAFGKDNYWKVLIDGKVHANEDKHFYDRSKGFMASMMKGLNRIVANIDQPLDTEFVKALHTDATTLVTTESTVDDDVSMNPTHFQATGLKIAPNGWGVTKDYSQTGMDELAQLRQELNQLARGYFRDGDMRFASDPDRVVQWSAGKPGDPDLQGTVTTLMNHVIQKAYREIQNANGDKDKEIGAIIDCCRGLGIIHPFKDANGRLMMFLVLNKLLMEHDMPPTILEDQGFMVGKSKAELIVLIKQGQAKVRGDT